MLPLTKILYIDTESHHSTKKPLSVAWLYDGEIGVISEFNDNTYSFLYDLWNKAEGIVLFNAPYDLGVLSVMFHQNSYQWISKKTPTGPISAWKITLFDNVYDVRKISFFRNLIKNGNKKSNETKKKGIKSIPVIDLLKLWSILIDDGESGSISLKALIKKHFKINPIEYTPENSVTYDYQTQDVIYLEKLFHVFLHKIDGIEEIKNFTLEEWGYIKTPATFTKILYQKQYPRLKEYQKSNDKVNKREMLDKPLEEAYHGGITLSMYRGKLKNTQWIDIKGAYSKAIEVLQTDDYLQYDILPCNINEVNFNEPFLLKCEVNFVMKSINKSLKLFYVNDPVTVYIWNYDVLACQNLVDNYQYKIIKSWKIVKGLNLGDPLPVRWNKLKDKEKNINGKTTLYNFFKFLSNTSYGIKAQRQPFRTVHTNMVIAGMITSKVHLILCLIIKLLRDNGFINVYNDTDSACSIVPTNYKKDIIKIINDKIYPFEVDDEGIYNTEILSLKRYVATSKDKKDKVKIHGKGRYKLNRKEMLDYVQTQSIDNDNELELVQLSATTERTMMMLLKIYPYLEDYKHPFMFEKNVKTDRLKSDFFEDWYYHIDTKTTWHKHAPFNREFHNFENIRIAEMFFSNRKSDKECDDVTNYFRCWDYEIYEDFTNR